MKKFLLVFGSLVLLSSFASAASPWAYKFNGYLNNIVAYGDLERYSTTDNKFKYSLDARVLGELSYKSRDFTIGLRAEAESDYIFKEGYVFLQFPFIRFEAGRALNLAEKLHVAVPEASFSRFNNDSYIYDLVNNTQVAHLTTTALNSDDKSQKLSIISSKWKGFQIGASYAPGQASGYNKKYEFYDDENDGHFENSYSAGIRFMQDWGYYKLAVSGGFLETNKANDIRIDLSGVKDSFEKRTEYSSGINLTLGNVVIGAAGRIINEVAPYNPSGNSYEGYVAAGGISYTFLQYAVSFDYQRSVMAGQYNIEGDDIVNLYQVSFKYNPKKKWHLWLSVGYIDMYDETELEENETKGVVGLLGLTYVF